MHSPAHPALNFLPAACSELKKRQKAERVAKEKEEKKVLCCGVQRLKGCRPASSVPRIMLLHSHSTLGNSGYAAKPLSQAAWRRMVRAVKNLHGTCTQDKFTPQQCKGAGVQAAQAAAIAQRKAEAPSKADEPALENDEVGHLQPS